jgi:hypothetical protein
MSVGKVVIILPEYLGKSHHSRRRRRKRISVWLRVGNVAVELIPNGVIHMDFTLDVGKAENLSIEVLDQNGQPIANPVFDAPPAWSQADATIGDLAASQDGLTAVETGLKAGTDTVQVDAVIGGITFTATATATINAVVPAQTPTSINIVATPA